MKLKTLKIDIFGLELKIQLNSSQAVQQEHPDKLVVPGDTNIPTIDEYLTPTAKQVKIKHINNV